MKFEVHKGACRASQALDPQKAVTANPEPKTRDLKHPALSPKALGKHFSGQGQMAGVVFRGKAQLSFSHDSSTKLAQAAPIADMP